MICAQVALNAMISDTIVENIDEWVYCSFASALKETMMLTVSQLIGTTANSYLLWQYMLFLHLCALSWVRIWPTLLLFLPWHLTFSISHLGLPFVWLLISDIDFLWLAISSENFSLKKKKRFVILLSLAIDMLSGLTILQRKVGSYIH